MSEPYSARIVGALFGVRDVGAAWSARDLTPDGWAARVPQGVAPAPTPPTLLLQTGSRLLLQTGSRLLLEDTP